MRCIEARGGRRAGPLIRFGSWRVIRKIPRLDLRLERQAAASVSLSSPNEASTARKKHCLSSPERPMARKKHCLSSLELQNPRNIVILSRIYALLRLNRSLSSCLRPSRGHGMALFFPKRTSSHHRPGTVFPGMAPLSVVTKCLSSRYEASASTGEALFFPREDPCQPWRSA